MILTVWSGAWWLSGKFTEIRKLVYDQSQKIIDKLEYHEKHDDQRFHALGNEIWAIKVRNASRDSMASEIIADIDRLKDKNAAQEEIRNTRSEKRS